MVSDIATNQTVADTRVNVTGRRNELRLRGLSLDSNAKEHAMKTITAGIVAAATLLSAAPAFAIDVDVGPGGIRIGPRYHDHSERYYRNRSDCRKVTIERPDGSVVTRYRCD